MKRVKILNALTSKRYGQPIESFVCEALEMFHAAEQTAENFVVFLEMPGGIR